MPSSFTNKDAGKVMLRPRGVYNPTYKYEPLDMVSHEGATYVAMIEITGITPPDDTCWQLASQVVTDEKFNINSKAPIANDEVTYAINGVRDTFKILGLKNFLKLTDKSTTTEHNVVYTIGSGIVTVYTIDDGAEEGYIKLNWNNEYISLNPGKYHFSGTPREGGGPNTFYLNLVSQDGTTINMNDYGEGFDFVINQRTYLNLYLNFADGISFLYDTEFRPMITYSYDTESDYDHFEPYKDGALITVDDSIDEYSLNPVQNKAIYDFVVREVVGAVLDLY